MEKVTFCINTSRNESDHIQLLFESFRGNFSSHDHEIIVFVDSDNGEILPFLKSQKSIFPHLKIVKNNWPIPVSYQENINYMFREAKNDVVSYLQSDMVVGPNYDVEVTKHLTPNIILSSTRVEPPLHPPGPEKFTMNFGLSPSEFQIRNFNDFCTTNRSDRITHHFFAPFTLHREVWNRIGGHDVQFRRSREDSDMLWRLLLSGVEVKQCWNSFVYHFSCTSSRGKNWWQANNLEAQRKAELQKVADEIELRKFLRKWGSFRHPSTFEEAKHYKYDVGVQLKNCGDTDDELVYNLFHIFNKISVDNQSLLPKLRGKLDEMQIPANTLIGVSDENWSKYGKFFNQSKFEDIFVDNVDSNVVMELDIQEMKSNSTLNNGVANLQAILHDNVELGDNCQFEMEGQLITVNGLRDVIGDNIVVNNPKFDMDIEVL